MLDGRLVNLNLDKYITPQTVHHIPNEGLVHPIEKDEGLQRHLTSFKEMPRGDLYVRFNIVFPTDLNDSQKKSILTILRQNEAELKAENEDE